MKTIKIFKLNRIRHQHFLCSIAFLLFSLLCSCEVNENESYLPNYGKITIEGQWQYEMTDNGSAITTKVESKEDGKIKNNRNTRSGSLRLKLYLTSSKYDGEEISGYVMADYTLSEGKSLEPGHYYYDISFSDIEGFPPYGTYYVTLVLLEYDGDYYIEDYLNFDNTIIVYSTKKSNSVQNERYDM